MNDITKIEHNLPLGERINKCFEVILPDKDSKINFAQGGRTYKAGDIIVVAPLCKYSLSSPAATHIFLERALLSVKDVLIFRDDENGGVKHAAMQAEAYMRSTAKNSGAVLAALGNLLVSYITLTGKETSSPVVETVKGDIESNLTNVTYSLEDSLKKLPLNYDYVRKLFKKETGATPHGYLLSRRMELARGLIISGLSNRYSAYTVSQIAEACGFAEPLYFSRVFKKYYGVAPSEYGK
ncbi:MAG: helix-turn-helix transcriptional regulator [Clostridia bacterium]|nr:helix-turn-helix transcriptional regulator [Clostridia bacterium]